MKKVYLKKDRELKFYDIDIAVTERGNYDGERMMLILNDMPEPFEYCGEPNHYYIVAHGYHCSCYGFEDTQWEYIAYTSEELTKLANVNRDDNDFYPLERDFYKLVKKFLE